MMTKPLAKEIKVKMEECADFNILSNSFSVSFLIFAIHNSLRIESSLSKYQGKIDSKKTVF